MNALFQHYRKIIQEQCNTTINAQQIVHEPKVLPNIQCTKIVDGVISNVLIPPSANHTIKIGSDPGKATICIRDNHLDPVHLVAQRLGDNWYFVECGTQPVMEINGSHKRDEMLTPNKSIILKIFNQTYLFSIIQQSPTELKENTFDCHFILPSQTKLNCTIPSVILVGSSPQCQIKLSKSAPIALGIVIASQQNIIAFPVNDYKIKINQTLLQRSSKLYHLNIIEIDNQIIKLHCPNALPQKQLMSTITNNISMPQLALAQISENNTIDKNFTLPTSGKFLFVGRDKESGLCIDTTAISRVHAQLIVYDNHLMILDCHSTNGSYINGQRISKSLAHPGDIVTFANHHFILTYNK